jgi:3'-phosphoadenosine 5'-phosphosulfate sulfotransferase (PAPS reductase)/FAD synthetase
MNQHLVSVSGGKDSTAVYLLAIESGRPFRAVFADTGNEHEATYEYVDRLAERTGGPTIEVVKADFTEQLAERRARIAAQWPTELMAGRDGLWEWRPLRGSNTPRPGPEPQPPKNHYRPATVRADGGAWRWRLARRPMAEADALARVRGALEVCVPTGIPFLDCCLWKGFFPGRMRQFCTEQLKTLPITEQVVLPMLKQGPVLQWIGIRADESDSRAKQPRYNRHDSGSYLWRPIFNWKVEEVWKQHSRHGLHPNPLYALGASRVGCWACVNCRKEEVRLIADLTPEHIARLREWERLVAQASKYGQATFFPAMTDSADRDRRDRYSGIDDIVEWSRTSRGGRQFDLFFQQQGGGGCTSDLALCELGGD